MIFLDPVNAVTSVRFYRKVAQNGPGRSVLFFCYLALLFAVASCAAVKFRVKPAIDQTFSWLETSMPKLTFQNGKLSSDAEGPVTVRHPEIPELALVVDTARTTPVTPKDLDEAKTQAYLTQSALYVRERPGSIQAFDFSKGAGAAAPVTLDAAFYRKAAGILGVLLYPIAGLSALIVFVFWKLFSTLFYSVVALALNAVAGAGLAFPALLNIALYAQTLVIVLQIVFLFMPRGIPGFGVLGPLATGVYIWLGIKAAAAPESQPAA